MSMPTNVSFTIRRPTPVSRESSEASESEAPSSKKTALPRHLANSSTPGSPLARSSTSTPYQTGDSSDSEDDQVQDELVTGFDQFGVQRAYEKKGKKPDGPLVIPALKNKDWRDIARQRRGQSFVPDSARAGATGADGSVGGLGTRDTINSGPQFSGLQVKQAVSIVKEDVIMTDSTPSTPTSEPSKAVIEETEDERARRLLLAGDDSYDSAPAIIPLHSQNVSESDAFKQDVQELPESATLDDYARVPIHQFGAALLRGMGWKEGEAASKRVGKDGKRKGIVEPYLPEARPALLGIGAKEKEIYDDGSKKKSKGPLRPERRYVPIVKRESQPSSQRNSRSRSPSRKRNRDDSKGDGERSSRRYRDDDYDSGRERKSRDRERDYRSNKDKRDYDDSRDRRDHDDRKRRDYDSGKDKERRRDYSPDRRDSKRDYR